MVSSKERFSIYRRMFATADDGVVSWWYSGLSYVTLPDQPEIPLSQISAIMTYRTETVSASAFRVHWSEIGVFSSPVTGEEPGPWTNMMCQPMRRNCGITPALRNEDLPEPESAISGRNC